MKKPIVIAIFCLIFIGCGSTPRNSEPLPNLIDIDKDIYDKLENTEVILWGEGVKFIDLDLSNRVKVKEIVSSEIKVTPRTNYTNGRTDYFVTICFTDEDGNEKELTFSRRITEISKRDQTYNERFERNLIFGEHYFTPDLILYTDPIINDQPRLHYGKGYSVDVTGAALRNIILIYDQTLHSFKEQLSIWIEKDLERQRVNVQNSAQNQRTSIQNLIYNLTSIGYGIDLGIPFIQGDIISLRTGQLYAIDLARTGNQYNYLVTLSDGTDIPFYIRASKPLQIIGSSNIVYDAVRIRYIGKAQYIRNRVITADTLLFELVD